MVLHSMKCVHNREDLCAAPKAPRAGRRRSRWRAAAGGALLAAVAVLPVSAYIDPGSAGLPFQTLGPFLGMLAALFAAGLVFLRTTWGRFRKPFYRLLLLLACLLLLSGLIFHILKPRMTPPSKVIVIGMDGLDHRLLKTWMEDGTLPHFSAVAGKGVFLPLETVSPPQSPVAWCTFATGANPGVHGVFDFLQRTPKTYYPHLTLLKTAVNSSPWNTVPFEKVRAAPAFWELTTAKKIPTVVVRHPVTFPPEKVEGRMLSGLGVPDLLGGLGRYTFYTVPPFEKPADFRGELVFLKSAGALWTGDIPGPKNPSSQKSVSVPFTLSPRAAPQKSLRLTVEKKSYDVEESGWSPWVRVSFRPGTLKKIHGLCRFYLASLSPLRLYQTPLNFDPEEPAFPISYPSNYSKKLAESIGPYYTLGMDEDTNALSDEVISDEAFLEQCGQIMDQRDAMLREELKRFESGLLMCVYDTPDRIQHMFWRAVDETHPLHGRSAAQREAVRGIYRRLDETLGHVLPFVDDKTLLVVLSDHGFASFRRAVHLNRWLVDNGYLVLKDPRTAPEHFFTGVDWAKSKAYSLGLGGGIYINLQGREPAGIVAPAEADKLAEELMAKIQNL
ncbi:MAG TPA: alkaline phosphatase family protein, partial [Elusimicrobiota bacterium]|nr:alkaline phosphatase family protein [Elusimicrobiota bacterium]